MAKEADGFPSIVNCNDSSFLAPKSMTDAVRYYCERTGQKIPQSMGEVMVVIYNSLAQSWLWKRLFTFTNLGNQLGILLVMVIPSLVMACCLTVDIGRRTINSHLSLTKKSFV